MENNIIEGNKAIAEFMGGILKPYPQTGELTYWFEPSNTPTPNSSCWWGISELQYHKSWSWLMPVVEKIESIEGPYAVTIDKYSCRIDYVKLFNNRTICIIGYDEMQKIEGVWQAVVEFINWHNQNQSK